MTTAATTTNDKSVATKRKSLPELLQDAGTLKRFEDMLGKDARSFQQNILTVFNNSKALAECDPESIIAAAGISASINLSILPSLGHSCLVPYREGKDGPAVAQWQIMYKGLIQLAHRSGQYKRVHLARVYDGQLVSYDEHRGVVKLQEKRNSARVQGYFFYFELNNGGAYEFYWPARKAIEHGLRYSKSFQKGNGKWTEDPEFQKAGSVQKWLDGKEHFLTEGSGADAMSAKSIVKNELNKWGPLETRIKETVQEFDQAAVGPDGRPTYIDTTAEPATETKTYTAPPQQEKGKEPTPAEKLQWARDAAKKQGVSNETFDAWLAQQPGDEAAKAEAATVAWKKVAMKQATAVEVFKVQPAGETVTIKVSGVATTDVDGSPDWWAIRDTSEPAVKYLTDNKATADAATEAKKKGSELTFTFSKVGEGKKAYNRIIQLS